MRVVAGKPHRRLQRVVLIAAGASADIPSAGGGALETKEPAPCPPADASTGALLRCIAWRQETGQDQMLEEAHVPTEEADESTQKFLSGIGQDSRELRVERAVQERGFKVHTPQFVEQFTAYMQTGTGLPRIFAIDEGRWDRVCEWTTESLGYRYSLEQYMHKVILGNGGYLVQDIRVADFVYLPHCATGILMHAAAKEEIEKKELANRVSGQRRKRKLLPNASTEEMPTVVAYLEYEGYLPKRSTRQVDGGYLIDSELKRWRRAPEFQVCLERSSCRFLIVSIYGRHVWRALAGAFADKAVFLTHAGLSSWLSRQEGWYLPQASRRRVAKAKPECRAICPLHCQRDPPPVLKDDIVLPWIVAFGWTKRSGNFRSRDIHVFYSGTENSCARTKLHDMFRQAAEVELQGNSSLGTGGKIIIFPPERRLLQEEWSELAFRSRLCLVPDGDSPNTGRLIEVIMHGCVPIVISDRLQPPLHEHFDWSKVAFFLHEDGIDELRGLLRRFATPGGLQDVEAKQEVLAYAARMLDYNKPGVMSMLAMALRERVLRFWAPGTRPENEHGI